MGKFFFIAPEGLMSEEDKAKFGDSVVIFPCRVSSPAEYQAPGGPGDWSGKRGAAGG